MAIITKNEYGSIVINNKLLTKLVIDELLKMQSIVYLCNKKGKIIKKKSTPFIEPDYYDAVELSEIQGGSISIKIYLISRLSTNIKDISNKICEKVYDAFDTFNLDKPDKIIISYQGIIAEHNSKKRIEVKRLKSC